ncbi:MAG: hypothetical protein SGJ09_07820 [Phycisphaerae bacterium]|nr:hypothetical protein [Phycisphaerae bacterium]
MTTALPAAPDAELLRSLEAGDERAIELAIDALGAGVSPKALLATVKALLAVGLPSAATTLLRTVGQPLLTDPTMGSLANRLGSLRSDRVPKELQLRWADSNCAVLRQVGVDVAADALAALESERIDVLRDNRNRTHPVVANAAGEARSISSLRFRLTSEERRALEAHWPCVAALAGLPTRHVLDEALSISAGRRPSASFVAFESDPLAIAAWLRSGDFASVLADGRLRLRLEIDGAGQYLESMRGRLDMPPFSAAIVVRFDTPMRAVIQRLPVDSARRWMDEREVLTRLAIARYRERDASYWLPRFRAAGAGRAPLRVLGIVSRHTNVVQFMMRDLLAAFSDLGHSVELVTEPGDAMPELDAVSPFTRSDIDLVLVINHLRAFPNAMIPVDVPFCSWMQDASAPAQTSEGAASQSPLSLLVTQSPGYWESCFGYPRGRSLAAPNLTSWRLYAACGDEARQSGAPDVVYVGHGWESVATLNAASARSPIAAAVLRDVSDEFRARLDANDPPNGFERMRIEAAAVKRHGAALGSAAQALYWACLTAYDRMFRHQALEWTARWATSRGRTFAIYGEGWHQHPTLGRFARGPIANGRPLAELCRDAGAVVHANANASLHQRLLDGLAAGGCVLTRRNPADELSQHHRTLSTIAREQGLTTLRGAIDAATTDERIRDALDGIERTLGCAVALAGTSERDRDLETIRTTAFWPAETMTDDGFFRHLASERGLITPHGAADLDGFAASTYGTEVELHALLDRVVGSDAFRATLAAPMRASVGERFTMEWLAGAIIAQMTRMLQARLDSAAP